MLEGESLTFLKHAPHLTLSLPICWLSSLPPHQHLHDGDQEVERLPRTEGWSWAPRRPYQQEDDPERPHGHPAHPQALSDLSGPGSWKEEVHREGASQETGSPI